MNAFISINNGKFKKCIYWLGSIIGGILIILSGLKELKPYYLSARNMFRGTEEDVILIKREQKAEAQRDSVIIKDVKEIKEMIQELIGRNE